MSKRKWQIQSQKNLNLCQISHLNVSVNIHHRLKLPRKRGQYVVKRCFVVKNAYKPKLNGQLNWLHRCWWQMLETKCVGDNFEMLVTFLAVFVTNILYLLTYDGVNVGHQQPKDVTNIEILSLRSKICHQDKVTNIHLSPTSMQPLNSKTLNPDTGRTDRILQRLAWTVLNLF